MAVMVKYQMLCGNADLGGVTGLSTLSIIHPSLSPSVFPSLAFLHPSFILSIPPRWTPLTQLIHHPPTPEPMPVLLAGWGTG